MVSNVRYNSFKDINLGGRVPFRYILLVVVAFVLIVIDPPRVLFGAFFAYAVSGPIMALQRKRRRGREAAFGRRIGGECAAGEGGTRR